MSVEWLFFAFLIVSMIHMGEEYFYPGGFMDLMKHFNPRFAPLVTVPMAIVVNGLQLVLCVAAIVVGTSDPVFSMSVGGLIALNGLMHIGASIRMRGYAPGVISGALLYVPLATYAYMTFIRAGLLTIQQVLLTGVLGLLYQLVPILYLSVGSAVRGEVDR